MDLKSNRSGYFVKYFNRFIIIPFRLCRSCTLNYNIPRACLLNRSPVPAMDLKSNRSSYFVKYFNRLIVIPFRLCHSCTWSYTDRLVGIVYYPLVGLLYLLCWPRLPVTLLGHIWYAILIIYLWVTPLFGHCYCCVCICAINYSHLLYYIAQISPALYHSSIMIISSLFLKEFKVQ